MIFMGIVGEYIGAIHTFVQKRPLVFEKERINFQYDAALPAQDGVGVEESTPGLRVFGEALGAGDVGQADGSEVETAKAAFPRILVR
jgi:hypothetical protein